MKECAPRSVQIRPRAYPHTHTYTHSSNSGSVGGSGSHISSACTRNYTPTTPAAAAADYDDDDDFLSRSRGSMNGPWAINGPHATHTHSVPSSPLCPAVHARALTRSLDYDDGENRGDDGYEITVRPHALFFPSFLFYFLSPSLSFSLSPFSFSFSLSFSSFSLANGSQRKRADRTAGYDLALARHPCALSYALRESRLSWERLSRGRAKIGRIALPNAKSSLPPLARVCVSRITPSSRFHVRVLICIVLRPRTLFYPARARTCSFSSSHRAFPPRR